MRVARRTAAAAIIVMAALGGVAGVPAQGNLLAPTPAYAEEAKAVATINGTDYPTLADAVKALKEGDVLTLHGTIEESVSVTTPKVTIKADADAKVLGSITFAAGSDGSVIDGVTFDLDGSDAHANNQSVIIKDGTNITVQNCKFSISGKKLGERQYSSVWVQGTTSDDIVKGNTFTITPFDTSFTKKNNDRIGINVVGPNVKGLTVSGNTVVSLGEDGVEKAPATTQLAHGGFLMASGNTADGTGIDGLVISGNTISSTDDRSVPDANIAARGLKGVLLGGSVSNVSIDGNTFGRGSKFGVQTYIYGSNSPVTKVSIKGNTFQTDSTLPGAIQLAAGSVAKHEDVTIDGNAFAPSSVAIYDKTDAGIMSANPKLADPVPTAKHEQPEMAYGVPSSTDGLTDQGPVDASAKAADDKKTITVTFPKSYANQWVTAALYGKDGKLIAKVTAEVNADGNAQVTLPDGTTSDDVARILLYSENGLLLASLEDGSSTTDEYGKDEANTNDGNATETELSTPENINGNGSGTQSNGTLEQTGAVPMDTLGLATTAGAIAAGIGYLAVSKNKK